MTNLNECLNDCKENSSFVYASLKRDRFMQSRTSKEWNIKLLEPSIVTVIFRMYR